MTWTKPAEIERESMRIIDRELAERGIVLPPELAPVVKRVIHTTADFDYAKAFCFTENAVRVGADALRGGVIVTDTNMARSGVNRRAAEQLGCEAYCYMSEESVAAEAKERGVTRAVVSVERALAEHPNAVFAIGNAPTALLELAEQIDRGAQPALVIGVPVGFVNVTESKERAFAVCERRGVPAIVAMGRKGGSNVAAAICNALLYLAAGMLEPEKRS
ncbi:MAG: precorrin-8X methylmutase [Oscillospiraceae bacterium]|nr:precorrin-8X methylmutase [Oscillospiraceae bacterium]